MNKIKCIAIDDEPFALEIIADDIGRIPYLEFRGKYSSTAEAFDNLDGIDLLFLDIQMPTQTGTQFLKSLDNPPMVIFTTAYQQYALEGFDLKVVDYLLKPIPFERFQQATERAYDLFLLKKNQTVERYYLIVNSEYKKIKIYLDEILYIEGLKDYVKIFLKNQRKPILTRLNLKGIEAKLPENGFCRVHNSFLVALNQVNSYQKNRLVVEGIEIPIGARFYEDFLEKMAKS
ncbi:MAG: LytR/AlgR family response regulator transcription factor [Spirosomataceae bacterium]